ncbi:MAG: FliM/FliN family flagellar motor switch protein, partial [bacterium]|nr:FliM/FliN family flagellar motor switch protein [bacterium]
MQEEVEGGEEGAEANTQEEQPENEENQEDTSVDDMLEQEMLRAMQQEDENDGGGAVMPYATSSSSSPEMAEGIDRLSDIDVTVTVALGGNLVPIKDILGWQSDSIVVLGAEEHEPVDVLVNGKMFARGEVVVVGDTFGVRIIELLNAPDEL